MKLLRFRAASLALLAHACSSLPGSAAQTNEIISLTNTWSYYQSGSLDGVNWKARNFDDSAWLSGSALLYSTTAALPAPTNTPLVLGQNAYYFRARFIYSGGEPEIALAISALIDDGAVFYLNGVEIRRVGMPTAGIISYATPASRSVGTPTAFDRFTISGSVLTNLVPGENVLAVEVHQVDLTSSDIVFGSSASLITGLVPRVTRGPYLQNGTHTNLTIRWRTDIACDGRVRYGESLASLEASSDQGLITTEHEVKLTQLLPNTRYYYSIGSTVTPLAGEDTNHFFVTSPLPGVPRSSRIWVIGDSGTGDANQVRVRDAYAAFTGARHTDLWLMLGDNAYENGTDAEYQSTVFNVYTNLLRKSVVWPTLGNHDTAQSTAFIDTYPYFNIFSLPKNGEAGGMASGTEHYYSFDYANVHFVCLDSMTANRSPNGAMAIWLTNDLENVTADWIIAFWHHPVYSKGSHNSDSETELIQMRQTFLPILERYGADLVLAGHSHSYERSCLLDGHYSFSTRFSVTNKLDAGSGREGGTGPYRKLSGDPVGRRGTVYAVVGSSGQISGGPLNHPAMFISLNNLGSLALDISGDRLDASFIRENGVIADWFTMLKTNQPPVPPILSAPLDSAKRAARYPSLDVMVSDPDSNVLAVTFYGRSVPTPASADGEFFSTNIIRHFSGVTSGSYVSMTWSNLQPNTLHEWQVTVSDGKDLARGPIWRFTTAPNFHPEAHHLIARVPSTLGIPLQLAGSDANDDPLRFLIETPPRHGLISGFDPTLGSLFYTPAHGFSGNDIFKYRVSDGLADSAPAIVKLAVDRSSDSNLNGLPDSWEDTFGISDPLADADQDGLSNLQEFQANTDPTNAASTLRIASIKQEPSGGITLSWEATGGTRYRVSFSDSGTDLASFTDIVRPITDEMNPGPPGSSSLQSYTADMTEISPPQHGCRYYRIHVVLEEGQDESGEIETEVDAKSGPLR